MRILLFLSIFTVLISCKREGCTNDQATNYDEKAKVDDNSCSFLGTASFWLNESVSTVLTDSYGVTELNIYVNNAYSGQINPNNWTTGPDCGGVDLTTSIGWTDTESFSFSWSANDQGGNPQITGVATCTPNECASVQLVW